jgi:hypothetical protein
MALVQTKGVVTQTRTSAARPFCRNESRAQRARHPLALRERAGAKETAVVAATYVSEVSADAMAVSFPVGWGAHPRARHVGHTCRNLSTVAQRTCREAEAVAAFALRPGIRSRPVAAAYRDGDEKQQSWVARTAVGFRTKVPPCGTGSSIVRCRKNPDDVLYKWCLSAN